MRHLVAATALILALAVPVTALAEPLEPAQSAAKKKPKKCYKKKHGKRVRVKCPKKKQTPAVTKPAPTTPTTPTTPPTPVADPIKDRMTFLLAGEMMRHFTNSADPGGFQGEETLHTCSDKSYAYFSQFSGVAGGLTGTGKSEDAGKWEITQAELSPDQTEIFGKLKLTPTNGSAPYELFINLVDDGAGGIETYVNRQRWFRVASTVCS